MRRGGYCYSHFTDEQTETQLSSGLAATEEEARNPVPPDCHQRILYGPMLPLLLRGDDIPWLFFFF